MKESTAIRKARQFSRLSAFGDQWIIVSWPVAGGLGRESQPMQYERARGFLARQRAEDALEILGRDGSPLVPDGDAISLAIAQAAEVRGETTIEGLVGEALKWLRSNP